MKTVEKAAYLRDRPAAAAPILADVDAATSAPPAGVPTPLAERLREAFAVVTVDGIASAYLFGSHAAGRPHRESDVDVAVLLDRGRYPTREARFGARLRLIGELAVALKMREDRLDVVVLNDLPPLFGRKIVREGVRLFLADPEADHVYVRDVQLRAADLAPWLARMRKVKLEALRR